MLFFTLLFDLKVLWSILKGFCIGPLKINKWTHVWLVKYALEVFSTPVPWLIEKHRMTPFMYQLEFDGCTTARQFSFTMWIALFWSSSVFQQENMQLIYKRTLYCMDIWPTSPVLFTALSVVVRDRLQVRLAQSGRPLLMNSHFTLIWQRSSWCIISMSAHSSANHIFSFARLKTQLLWFP